MFDIKSNNSFVELKKENDHFIKGILVQDIVLNTYSLRKIDIGLSITNNNNNNYIIITQSAKINQSLWYIPPFTDCSKCKDKSIQLILANPLDYNVLVKKGTYILDIYLLSKYREVNEYENIVFQNNNLCILSKDLNQSITKYTGDNKSLSLQFKNDIIST